MCSGTRGSCWRCGRRRTVSRSGRCRRRGTVTLGTRSRRCGRRRTISRSRGRRTGRSAQWPARSALARTTRGRGRRSCAVIRHGRSCSVRGSRWRRNRGDRRSVAGIRRLGACRYSRHVRPAAAIGSLSEGRRRRHGRHAWRDVGSGGCEHRRRHQRSDGKTRCCGRCQRYPSLPPLGLALPSCLGARGGLGVRCGGNRLGLIVHVHSLFGLRRSFRSVTDTAAVS